MSSLHFDWDERKAVANENKHSVSFGEAKSVFVDERAKLIATHTTPKMKTALCCWG